MKEVCSETKYPGYLVTTHGRVYSLKTNKFLRSGSSTGGYRVMILQYKGIGLGVKVHVLVKETFNGPRPEKHDCCHLDGDKLNNRLDNLAWKTKSNHAREDYALGIWPQFPGFKPRKLTDDQVREARRSKETGVSLAQRFGVTPGTISYARSRKTFKDVL